MCKLNEDGKRYVVRQIDYAFQQGEYIKKDRVKRFNVIYYDQGGVKYDRICGK